jgi:hypothetical protein
MLPSLCRLMASIPSVSRYRGPADAAWSLQRAATGAGFGPNLASMPLAGSISTLFVARLYSEGPLR